MMEEDPIEEKHSKLELKVPQLVQDDWSDDELEAA
jgi:hypothetical protein